jgi:hypothetical protein
MIKSIFIQKATTGELIFYKTYEDIFEVNLTSSFLSAIFSFVKQTLKTEKLSEIEVGPFRFIFEIEKINSEELMFALFADRTDNLVELRNYLKEVKNQFLHKYDMGYLSDFDGEISRFYEFQKNIDNITEESEKLIPKELQDDVLEIFNELHTFSTFVIASALLTQTGRVIISFLDSNILSEIIKLLEARFLIGNNKITELITLESFGVLSLVGIDSYISAIQFKHNSPFESALIISRKFSSRLQKIIC